MLPIPKIISFLEGRNNNVKKMKYRLIVKVHTQEVKRSMKT